MYLSCVLGQMSSAILYAALMCYFVPMTLADGRHQTQICGSLMFLLAFTVHIPNIILNLYYEEKHQAPSGNS